MDIDDVPGKGERPLSRDTGALPRRKEKQEKRKEGQLRSTCDRCQEAKSRCSREQPCFRCKVHNVPCVYSPTRRIGRPPQKKKDEDSAKRDSTKRKSSDQSTAEVVEPTAEPVHRNLPPPPPLPTQNSFNINSPPSDSITNSDPSDPGDGFISDCSAFFFGDGINMPHWPGLMSYNTTGSLPCSVPFSSSDSDLHRLSSTSTSQFSLSSPDLMNAIPSDHPACDLSFMTQEKTILDQPHLSSLDSSGPFNNAFISSSLPNSRQQSTVQLCSSPSKDAIPPHVAQGHPNDLSSSAHRQPQPFQLPHPSRKSSPQHHDQTCECSKSVLRHLMEFEDSHSNRVNFAIDVILFLEKGALSQARQVLQCGDCSNNKPDVLLQLAVTVNKVVAMLEDISSVKFSNPSGLNLDRPLSPLDTSARGGTDAQPSEESLLEAMASRALLIGGWDVSGDDKVAFFQQFLRARLADLALTLQQLKLYMSRMSASTITKLGMSLVTEDHRRLHAVIEKLELGEQASKRRRASLLTE